MRPASHSLYCLLWKLKWSVKGPRQVVLTPLLVRPRVELLAARGMSFSQLRCYPPLLVCLPLTPWSFSYLERKNSWSCMLILLKKTQQMCWLCLEPCPPAIIGPLVTLISGFAKLVARWATVYVTMPEEVFFHTTAAHTHLGALCECILPV